MKKSTTMWAWVKRAHRENPTNEEYARLLQNPVRACVLTDIDLTMVKGGYGGPRGWCDRGYCDWDDDGYGYGRRWGRGRYGGYRRHRRGWW